MLGTAITTCSCIPVPSYTVPVAAHSASTTGVIRDDFLRQWIIHATYYYHRSHFPCRYINLVVLQQMALRLLQICVPSIQKVEKYSASFKVCARTVPAPICVVIESVTWPRCSPDVACSLSIFCFSKSILNVFFFFCSCWGRFAAPEVALFLAVFPLPSPLFLLFAGFAKVLHQSNIQRVQLDFFSTCIVNSNWPSTDQRRF